MNKGQFVLFSLWLTLTGTSTVFAQETPVQEFVPELSLEQVIEQNCGTPRPAIERPNLRFTRTLALPNRADVTSDQTISQEGLTTPSLWFAKEIYAGKLISNWLAYAPTDNEPGRVDIFVNRQYWSLLNYLERYQIVNKFGLVAWDYRYNLRFFNPQGNFLAAYTCAGDVNSPLCRICLDSTLTPSGGRR